MKTLSLMEASVLFGEMAEKVHRAEQHALEHAAKVVVAEAKEAIGTYQDAVDPFAAWPELADATKADRVRQGYSENDPGLRSGEMRDSIEHTVKMSDFGSGEAHIGSNDDKLVWFELGTVNQPPRSVLGGAAARKSEEVKRLLGDAAIGIIVGTRAI